MESARRLVGRAPVEDREAACRRELSPAELARILEGPGDRGLHERGRHAARPELLTQALAA